MLEHPAEDGIVQAAGGVLWRPVNERGDIEIGVVHRPRYHDWTLPKGKLERGETVVAAAVREIEEETGYSVRLGRFIRRVSYDVGGGRRRKHVHYWAAQAISGQFVANSEVDELRWLSPDAAAKKLTYQLDRKVLRAFRQYPADTHTTLLIRHAKAGRKARYRGDDRLRPLEKFGRVQAAALVPLLLAFGAERVHAADRTRCEQTVAPLADELGVQVTAEPLLTEEAYSADPDAALDRMRSIAGRRRIHAVCSQGKVIPPLLKRWAELDGVPMPATRNRKGSIWVLSSYQGRLIALDHIPSPLPTVAE
nr:NUDIX domain-containing protein [Jongsikchunia kroppenstedtii]